MGFGVLTLDEQCSLTLMLLNTNENALKGEDDQKVHFESRCLTQTKRIIDKSLAPVEMEIKLH